MKKYIISCCSTADLTKEHFQKIDVKYVCFHYELDGVSYMDDLGKTMPFEDFYKRMSQGADTKTSQVTAAEFEAFFEPYLMEGYDILHVCLSSGITGVMNSANCAKEDLMARYPQQKIYLIDSLLASSGYGLLLDTMADLKAAGMSIDELYEWTEKNKLRVNAWFFSTDLTFYIKGGRISKTAGTIGSMLNICPLLHMNRKGELILVEKVRSKRRVIERIVEMMQQTADFGVNYDRKCFISQSGCLVDAIEVSRIIEERFPKLNGRVQINYVGTTIGSHTGPGTVALFFWGKERRD